MFSRVLVANRGEIAVRVIRALHELGVEAVAVYSTADRTRSTSGSPTGPSASGRRPPRESYLRIPSVIAAAETTGCEAVHPGYGFLAGEPRVRARLRGQRPRLRRPRRRGDGAHGRQGAREGGDARGRRAARAGHRGRRLARRGARAPRHELGYPVLLKAVAGGGGKGMRLVDDGRRARGAPTRRRAARPRRRSATAALYLEKAIVAGAARRDPGALRRRRRRAHARRARVLDPAAAPEADRGVAVAGARRRDARGDGGGGRARVPRDRLQERGHVRVPARPGRQLLLHRAERAAPGRASRSASS